MNKNVIYYSLNIPKWHQIEYYSMLYHSLATLKKYYNNEFDVVVFYNTPAFENNSFEQYMHLNRYKIIDAFPFVKFIKSDYKDKDWYMTKWYHFPKLFDMGYEKVFFLDCDTMFFDKPDFFFLKYSSNSFWALQEGLHNTTKQVLGEEGINSGQVLISKKIYDKIPNFYKTLVNKRKQLIKKAEKLNKNKKLSDTELDGFKYFSEQYCAQMAFKDVGVPIEIFDTKDITYGGARESTYRVVVRRDQVFIETNVVILHYTSAWAYTVIPENLHTSNMTERYRKDPLFSTKLLTPRYSTMV